MADTTPADQGSDWERGFAQAVEETRASPLTFGAALRSHRCYGNDSRCYACGAWMDAEVVTPSRTDRQPPNPVPGANSGETPVRPGETKSPDSVTTHEGTT